MNLRRMWNSLAPRSMRCLNPVTFALWLIILATLTCLLVYNLDRDRILNSTSTPDICFEDVGQQRARSLYATARVRIIPSRPGDRKEEENPTLNSGPCISIPVPPYRSKDSSITICIHDPEKDKIVSSHLKENLRWERDNIQAVYDAHVKYPNLMLVDLGCNLGTFTLPAARMGLHVLAVDAMMLSLQLLQKSLFINGLSCHVTLVHNALYRQRMPMRVALDPRNVGGSKVVEIMASRQEKVPLKDRVDAICLDDLVPLVKGREVFLKMDIEETEDAVLECAHKFFKEVDVKILLMEWLFFRNQEAKARAILDFMAGHGMRPAWGLDPERDIDPRAAHSWPDNVFWIKKT